MTTPDRAKMSRLDAAKVMLIEAGDELRSAGEQELLDKVNETLRLVNERVADVRAGKE